MFLIFWLCIEITTLKLDFEKLVNNYEDTINRKYKILACEISKNGLYHSPEVLLESNENMDFGVKDLMHKLNVWIEKWNRDASNFEYQFNYFKNRLISIHTTAMHKMPNLNFDSMMFEIEDIAKRESIKTSLQSMSKFNMDMWHA